MACGNVLKMVATANKAGMVSMQYGNLFIKVKMYDWLF